MNKYHKASLIFLILGICLFIIGMLTGEVEAGFFIIFPILIGSGIYAFLGVICIFIAFLTFMFGFTKTTREIYGLQDKEAEYYPSKKTSLKTGGVVLIGPIPIVFGSNWKIAVIMMLLAIALIIVAFLTLGFL